MATALGLFGAALAGAPVGAATAGIEGASWRLTGLPGTDAKVLAGLPHPVSVRFHGGRVSGFSGCNNLMGSYTLEGESLKLGPLAGSMMACPEPANSIESAFRAAFSGSLRRSLAGELLTLTPESGGALTFEKEPKPRLEGVTWEATGFNNNRQAVVGLQAEGQITFSFADGTVSGSAGCNSFRSPYTAEGNRIKIGPAVTTRKTCAESLMLQERQFLAALESAVVWAIDGNVLDMHRADDERAVMATAGRR
jgi:heat shock protein HslJ